MFKKSFDLKQVSEDGGEIVAYAATFDRVPDSYGDIIAPGAFAKSLEEWGASGHPIPLLFGHRTDDPRMNIGAVISAEEDEKGLRIRARFDSDNDVAQYSRKLVLEGRLAKLSFAYETRDQEIVELDDGTHANELRDLKLYEVSLVPIPANDLTYIVDAKSGDIDEAAAEAFGEDIAEKAAEADEKAPADEVSDALAAIRELAERLDEIAEMIDDMVERIASAMGQMSGILDEVKGKADENGIDAKSAEDDEDGDESDNAEVDEVDNAEVDEKHIMSCLAKMAKYIQVADEEGND